MLSIGIDPEWRRRSMLMRELLVRETQDARVMS